MDVIQAYRTTDGQLFDNQLAAERHQVFVDRQDIIEGFLESELNDYKGSAHRGIAAKSVINWEIYKANNGIVV
jgi:hypothetical protein